MSSFLQLSRLETPELLEIKASRSKGEYCWTLTPFFPRFVFEADADVGRVTYVDADLWFGNLPRRFSVNSMLPRSRFLLPTMLMLRNTTSRPSGQFCVQFMTFTRNGGDVVRSGGKIGALNGALPVSKTAGSVTRNISTIGLSVLLMRCMFCSSKSMCKPHGMR